MYTHILRHFYMSYINMYIRYGLSSVERNNNADVILTQNISIHRYHNTKIYFTYGISYTQTYISIYYLFFLVAVLGSGLHGNSHNPQIK